MTLCHSELFKIRKEHAPAREHFGASSRSLGFLCTVALPAPGNIDAAARLTVS